MISCPIIILKSTSVADRLPAHLFPSPAPCDAGDEATSGIPLEKDRGNVSSPFCSHGNPTAYGSGSGKQNTGPSLNRFRPLFYLHYFKMSPFAENKSGCQGPVLFHEIYTTKRQTFLHMAAFMSNGIHTVVREPFHRIGVTEKFSERCLGTHNFVMRPGYELDETGVRFSLRVRSFSLSNRVRTGPTTNAMASGRERVYPRIKRPKP